MESRKQAPELTQEREIEEPELKASRKWHSQNHRSPDGICLIELELDHL